MEFEVDQFEVGLFSKQLTMDLMYQTSIDIILHILSVHVYTQFYHASQNTFKKRFASS